MTKSIRPNPNASVLFDRGVRLAAGLAVVVAIPMAVLFYFQFRSLNDLEATSAVVLHQLSSDTAESLTRSIEEHLKRPHISVLLRVPQARTEPLDFAWIDPVFYDGLKESPFVDAFYVWTERGATGTSWWVFDQTSFNHGARPERQALSRGCRGRARSCCRASRSWSKMRRPSSRSPRSQRTASTTSRPSCVSRVRHASA